MATMFSHLNTSIILTDDQVTVIHVSKASNEKKVHVFDIEDLLSVLDVLITNFKNTDKLNQINIK